MEKDLFGEKVPQIKSVKKGSYEKSVYFTQISCPCFEQYGLYGSKIITLSELLKSAFNENNSNYDKVSKAFSFTYKNQEYIIEIIESTEDYYFGKLSTKKDYNDILEEYTISEGEELKSITIRYFTFFYIDINQKALVYISKTKLKNLNKIFMEYIFAQTKQDVKITLYGQKNLMEKLGRSNKLDSITFQVSNPNISRAIDDVLSWERDMEVYEIAIRIKKPSCNYVGQVLTDNQKLQKVRKPRLKYQDENLNNTVAYLFEDYFTVKENITIEDVDLDKYPAIKNKLISAMNKYMVNEE